MLNTTIVNGLNYFEKFKQLEVKLSLLGSSVNKRFDEINIETTEKKSPSSLIFILFIYFISFIHNGIYTY